MAIYQRGAGAHVAERVQPEPGSAEEERLDELVAKGEGGWHRVEDASATPAASAVERPARSANKGDWVAYAQAVDPDTGGLDELTKDQLIELYGGEGDGA
ncbi:hypothetical protein QA995_14805 [Streptomyces scabiei]|uniref:hypothetical protein n=1 Tax=Streptomyces scabiei TaxID=1930 RepID=UPI002FF04E2E